MSSQYNPDGSIPQATKPWTQVAISSSTNASPIVITTSGAHGFTDGDNVEVEGHAVNTAANGNWKITVLTVTTFSLNGSTGNGVGGATGYAVDYSVNPLLTLPADLVDLMNVSSINPAIEGAANAIPFLYKRAGQYRLQAINSSTGGTLFTGAGNTSITNTGWTSLVGLTDVFDSVWNVRGGDLLEIGFDGSFAGTNGLIFATSIALNLAGAGLVTLAASVREASIDGIGAETFVRNSSLYLAPSSGSYSLAIQARANGGSSTLQSVGVWECIVKHWRLNS